MHKKVVVILMAGTFLLGGMAAGAARAADSDTALTTQATRMDRYATSTKGQTQVTNRTAADFSSFYGEENSQALASGLRSGKEITLTSQETDGSTSTTTFTPPTGKMGNGEAYISMALAKQQLTAAGITNPTAQQTQTAMMGGTLTSDGQQTQGVLQMRASGMGWGQIAQAYGTKLGPVISSMKTANTALSHTSTIKTRTTTTTTTTGATKSTTSHGKSGIVTGAGGGANVVGGKGSGGKSGIVTGAGGSGGKSGIVTGAGGNAGGISSPGAGSHGQGAGIVTGGGGAAGGSGGQGKAYGKGGSK